ncbi:hypothetical protein L596_018758 [Steinernema carpocapsae]|uniref:Uncharacterized protein n=1 Tax=Steinernema carpocapsae TaxID=34508 RepID=A0A4U5N5K8_STECR|nr:hypothetical protein L596_018758 [Steinernema carpocapsae]
MRRRHENARNQGDEPVARHTCVEQGSRRISWALCFSNFGNFDLSCFDKDELAGVLKNEVPKENKLLNPINHAETSV